MPAARIIAETPEQTAEKVTRGMLSAWAADPNSPMAVLLRAGLTSQDAAEILRGDITSDITPALATVIDAPDARLRAASAGAILVGVASQRYLLHMPDLHDVDTDDILRLITPLILDLIAPRQHPSPCGKSIRAEHDPARRARHRCHRSVSSCLARRSMASSATGAGPKTSVWREVSAM